MDLKTLHRRVFKLEQIITDLIEWTKFDMNNLDRRQKASSVTYHEKRKEEKNLSSFSKSSDESNTVTVIKLRQTQPQNDNSKQLAIEPKSLTVNNDEFQASNSKPTKENLKQLLAIAPQLKSPIVNSFKAQVNRSNEKPKKIFTIQQKSPIVNLFKVQAYKQLRQKQKYSLHPAIQPKYQTIMPSVSLLKANHDEVLGSGHTKVVNHALRKKESHISGLKKNKSAKVVGKRENLDETTEILRHGDGRKLKSATGKEDVEVIEISDTDCSDNEDELVDVTGDFDDNFIDATSVDVDAGNLVAIPSNSTTSMCHATTNILSANRKRFLPRRYQDADDSNIKSSSTKIRPGRPRKYSFSDMEESEDNSEKRQKRDEDIDLSCPVCEKPMKTEERLEKHLISHEPKGKKKQSVKQRRPKASKKFCPICRKQFSWNWNLNRHINTHDPEELKEKLKIVCPICDKPCLNLDYMKRHLMQSHDNQQNLEIHSTVCDPQDKCLDAEVVTSTSSTVEVVENEN